MVVHKYKTIFIHIPKTAGQSIESYFLNLLGLDWDTRAPLLLMPNKNKKLGPPYLAHLKADEYVEKHYVSKEIFDDYFKFAFVRNPWSRTVSFYKYFNYDLLVSFNFFVYSILPKLFKTHYWFVCPQFKYIMAGDKISVDFIGRVENLNHDFEKVCIELILDDKKLPHKNKSVDLDKKKSLRMQLYMARKHFKLLNRYNPDQIKSNNYREYYNKKLVKKVSDYYNDDVKMFNYSF